MCNEIDLKKQVTYKEAKEKIKELMLGIEIIQEKNLPKAEVDKIIFKIKRIVE